jgi:hypothetical protein
MCNDSGGSTGNPASPEGVSGWQERLWASLVAFEAVQMEHSQAFANGRRDHLMARRAEREKALARLHMAVDAAHHELLVGRDGGFAERVRVKLSTLIDNETALAASILKVRQHMVDELAAMLKGRRVLQGYSQRHGRSPRSRFLNRKT